MCESPNIPPETSSIPIDICARAPILAFSLPAKGESSVIITVIGSERMPAWSGE